MPLGSASQVAASTTPDGFRPTDSWNCFTASSVSGPNMPSTTSERLGVRRRPRCACLTASPWSPYWTVGHPVLGMVLLRFRIDGAGHEHALGLVGPDDLDAEGPG